MLLYLKKRDNDSNRDLPVTCGKTLLLAPGLPFVLLYLTGPKIFWIPYDMLIVEIPGYMANKGTKNPFML